MGVGLSRNRDTTPETTHAAAVPSVSGGESDPIRSPEARLLPDVNAPGIQADTRVQGSAAPASAPEPTEWQAWHGNGFTLDYPPGWTIIQKMTPDGPRVQFNAPEPDVSVLVDTAIARSGLSPLAEWQDLDRRLRRAHGPSYQLYSLEPSSIDGNAAAVWVFTLVRKDQPILMKKTDIGLSHDGRSYALLLAAPAVSYEARQGQFDRVRSSFHLTGL